MSYYFSGSVRKRYVSPLRAKIRADRRARNLERIKNILLIVILIACYIAAGWIDGSTPR